jgi:hypothetical protein
MVRHDADQLFAGVAQTAIPGKIDTLSLRRTSDRLRASRSPRRTRPAPAGDKRWRTSGDSCSTVSTSPPAISGNAEPGDVLSVSNGTWGNNPTGSAYPWEICESGDCTPISGATSSSYMPRALATPSVIAPDGAATLTSAVTLAIGVTVSLDTAAVDEARQQSC